MISEPIALLYKERKEKKREEDESESGTSVA